MKNWITILAIYWVRKQLREDAGLYRAYQSNIAMSIYDNYNWYFPLTTGKNSPTLHEWCNICATHFMKKWIEEAK